MSMFCYQCQETAACKGCQAARGVCGKSADTADLQDLLVYLLKGLSAAAVKAECSEDQKKELGDLVQESLFMTITNANFDDQRFQEQIKKVIEKRDELVKDITDKASLTEAAVNESIEELKNKAGVLKEENEDIRSLKELITYGVKGISAYAHHASVLDVSDNDINMFVLEALSGVATLSSQDELVALTLKTGEYAVKTMAMLDGANTGRFGNPEISTVNLGVGEKPGILVSGHDLRDLEELLDQSQGKGVDIYTHSEMLPANYYPFFKKYEHLKGNYGGSWWHQDKEFASFNGAILMTTNCITPVKDSYQDRIFTTGAAGYSNVPHIADRAKSGNKDFSPVIEKALTCKAPDKLEDGVIVGGFAHNTLMQNADAILEGIKSGAIKKFVVMAGCDGRHSSREYFTEVAKELPKEAIILTAGCAKYRYNKLDLGDINGIPRVLDAGQCNDSYSLAVIALKLKEITGAEDINDLPISFDIGWYEQKAVAVLLALLFLGVKNIILGPTLPAFISPAVADILVSTFGIKPTTTPAEDLKLIMS